MAFDQRPSTPQRIAIIGGGISGLSAAMLLGRHHRVTLFDRAASFGGHARTVTAGLQGDQPVDTGFIVFNYVTYPHLTRLFDDLGVAVERSDMSFGATLDGGRIEYALRAPFSQRRNLSRPAFLRMLADIARFNSRAEALAEADDLTIGDLIARLKPGAWFSRCYLLPICGAIWSTPPEGITAFPARALLRFFRNHGLLGIRGQHQWWTVSGGSIEYVRRLQARIWGQGTGLRPGTQVTAVSRDAAGVTLHATGCEPERFDQVVFACHSDQTLALLTDPDPEERAALSAIRYQPNRAVLHRGTAQMPRHRACWSSWIYRGTTTGPNEARPIGLTYWMNRLQNIPEEDPLFVTLNPAEPIRDELIYDETVFHHPVFDHAALAVQSKIAARQGQNRSWFAGAWLRNGFHEDGIASAHHILREMERQAV